MSRDLEILVAYERRLLRMEEDVSQDHTDTIQNRLMPTGKGTSRILRSYYDEMMDLTKELEENENGLFLNDQLKYFGTLTDRADRLMSRTSHLLEYTRQVKRRLTSLRLIIDRITNTVFNSDFYDFLPTDIDHGMVWNEL